MASKRKRVVLSLTDKLKIIERSHEGVSGKRLAEMYGVGRSTISDILKCKPSITKFVSAAEDRNGTSSRKSMKPATYRRLDDAVFKWSMYQRSMGRPVSGPALCKKAKIIAQKLGCSSFKASNGWLSKFKARHRVGESDSNNDKSSTDSIEKFKVLGESCSPELLYNADETDVVWKALPKNDSVSKSDKITLRLMRKSKNSRAPEKREKISRP